MGEAQALPRERESRLRRFGLALGFAFAALVHGAVLLYPLPSDPPPARKELQRGLVARITRPVAPAAPKEEPVRPRFVSDHRGAF